MDYKRNYFCSPIFMLFIITAVCNAASLSGMQDIAETEKPEDEIDETDGLLPSTDMTHKETSAVSSIRTPEGDIIITTDAQAVGGQSTRTEDTPDLPPNSVSDAQMLESSVPSETNTGLSSVTSEDSDETSVVNMETNSVDGSTSSTGSSTKSPNKPNTGKPESTSSSTTPNEASAVALPNVFEILLIAFVSQAFLLRT